MRVCPSCGFTNPEDAIRCALCGRALVAQEGAGEPTPAEPLSSPVEESQPPASAPTPPLHALPQPPAPNGRASRNAYLRGLAFGSIPLVIFWIFGGIAGYMQFADRTSPYNYAGATPFYAGIVLGGIGLVVLLFAASASLASRQTRFFGYGLLTMLLVSPIAGVLGCQIYIAALSALPR